jgi:hypothetical protein
MFTGADQDGNARARVFQPRAPHQFEHGRRLAHRVPRVVIEHVPMHGGVTSIDLRGCAAR